MASQGREGGTVMRFLYFAACFIVSLDPLGAILGVTRNHLFPADAYLVNAFFFVFWLGIGFYAFWWRPE